MGFDFALSVSEMIESSKGKDFAWDWCQ